MNVGDFIQFNTATGGNEFNDTDNNQTTVALAANSKAWTAHSSGQT